MRNSLITNSSNQDEIFSTATKNSNANSKNYYFEDNRKIWTKICKNLRVRRYCSIFNFSILETKGHSFNELQ